MNPIHQSNAPNTFEDPRCRGDFHAQHFPTANGREAPPVGAGDQNNRITLAFLAAYYSLNCGYSQLLEVRKKIESLERRNSETQCLQALEKILRVRDELEDRYAPFGVIAEPIVKEGFTVDLRISFGNVDAAGRRRSEAYRMTVSISIPWQEGITVEDSRIQIEGPGKGPK
jgi:hypothetical protein